MTIAAPRLWWRRTPTGGIVRLASTRWALPGSRASSARRTSIDGEPSSTCTSSTMTATDSGERSTSRSMTSSIEAAGPGIVASVSPVTVADRPARKWSGVRSRSLQHSQTSLPWGSRLFSAIAWASRVVLPWPAPPTMTVSGRSNRVLMISSRRRRRMALVGCRRRTRPEPSDARLHGHALPLDAISLPAASTSRRSTRRTVMVRGPNPLVDGCRRSVRTMRSTMPQRAGVTAHARVQAARQSSSKATTSTPNSAPSAGRAIDW